MVGISTQYSECFTTSGALFSFVYITESGDVDFSRSFLLPLNRNNHTLPFDLERGHYRVYAYDIEHDGILPDGEGYPAVTKDVFISNLSGRLIYSEPEYVFLFVTYIT